MKESTSMIERLRQRVLTAREHLKDGHGLFTALRLTGLPPIKGGVATTELGDLKNRLVYSGTLGNSIVPQTATSTVTGTGVDFDLASGPIFAFVHVGSVSGMNPTLDVKLQESDTQGGTYGDFQVTASLPTVVSANQFGIINGRRSKRWVRALATIGGATPSFAFAVSIVGVKREL